MSLASRQRCKSSKKRRVCAGDPVELTQQMLSAVLGPGLLGTVFDGLQNPLHKLAERDGYFLHRGSSLPALSRRH